MKKAPLALLASSALLVPGTVIASSAEATSGPSITNCYKTRHGVQVRIKVRDMGRTMRVRVSHPDGEGNFREPQVRWARTRVVYAGEAPPPDDSGGQIGGGVALSPQHFEPSFREDGSGPWDHITVSATFKLKNGKSISLDCDLR